jgi:metal-dependent amidase/aminoacylase/carboxypeptidase family protein
MGDLGALAADLEARLREVVEGTAKLYGAKVKLVYERNYPVTKNHPRQTAFARR